MSWDKLDISWLNSDPEKENDSSLYQKAEQEFLSASFWVDEQIKNIKLLVKSIIDPAQKKNFLKTLQNLQEARIKELRQISVMNSSLIVPKNDEFSDYIKVFSCTNNGMWLADNQSKSFILLNDALCKILEINASDYIWIDYPTFWNQFVADKDIFDKLKKEFKNNWEVNGWILPIVTPKWTNKWIEIHSVATEWHKEIFTIIDVTEKEKDRLGQLRAMDLLQHDIRWPLWSAERLLDITFNYEWATKLTEDETHVINEIRNALLKTIRVANCYLDFIRMEKWLFVPRFEEINLTSIIKEVCLSVGKGLLKEDKFEFIDEYWNIIDFKKNIYVDWELMYINILLFNLLKNAIEWSSEWKKVKINIREQDGLVMLVVNNDKEMPERIKKNVFRKQFVETSKPDGNGIGTYSMKLIVDMHWWTITFDSKAKEGTTMFVIIPKNQKTKSIETK